jgi:uncharacterized membrane protein
LGRKLSIKERAAIQAALEILDTTKNQAVKAQMVKLLLESDAREKARIDAREQRRWEKAQNAELTGLRSKVKSLKELLQLAEDALTSLKEERDNEIGSLNTNLAGKDSTISSLEGQLSDAKNAATETQQTATQELGNIASYIACPEYDQKVLSEYLKQRQTPESRTAALRVIVSNKSLSRDERRKLALEIVQSHKEARQQQPLKQFVDSVKGEQGITRDEDLEPDYSQWHKDPESDDPGLLFKLAVELEPSGEERQKRAIRMLDLFYGWTDFELPGLDHPSVEYEQVCVKLRAWKKRSIEEVEQHIEHTKKAEIENQRSQEDWEALVKRNNQHAKELIADGNSEALSELEQYRQCSNCTHVSHIDQTHQGHCHHCGRMNSGTNAMEWLPVVKLAKVPNCLGLFPCSKGF